MFLVFPLLSEALSRDRHHLGETTYVALLEMALLVDERDVPWCDQIHVTTIVKNVSMQPGFSGNTSGDPHKRKQRRGSTASLEATSSLWWDLQEDTNDGRSNGLIIDDTQLLHNILPLALIMQHLPNMTTPMQVQSSSMPLLLFLLYFLRVFTRMFAGTSASGWEKLTSRAVHLILTGLFS